MTEFKNKVAVITGAGSGIGKGLARVAASKGMKLVLADSNNAVLYATLEELANDFSEIEVFIQSTDVSDPKQVSVLADSAYEQFGQVDLLFNNAGIMQTGFCWQRSIDDWHRILNINLMGVIHGIHYFVPRMLAQQCEGHIVNTSSLAGLLAAPHMGPYTVSKQAVIALTETLLHDLDQLDAKLGVSVLCPGPIATDIISSAVTENDADPASIQLMDAMSQGVSSGMTPEECAKIVFEGIAKKQFWIFTHEDFKPRYQHKIESILLNTNPQYQSYVTED